MNTQNVKTAASESSETWGSSKGDLLLQVHNMLARARCHLKQGYSLTEGEPTIEGDHHVSIKIVSWFGLAGRVNGIL